MMTTDSGFIVLGGEKKGLYERGPMQKKWGETKNVTEKEQNQQQKKVKFKLGIIAGQDMTDK